MKTFIDCVPCFFNQAVKLAALSGADEKQTREIIDTLSGKIPGLSFSLSPPELSRLIYKIAADVTGVSDPCAGMKKKSNRLALKSRRAFRDKLDSSRERLLAAVKLAIAGNIIDYGTGDALDVTDEIAKLLAMEDEAIKSEDSRTFDYVRFKSSLAKSRRILYLADNAGEIVFDRILMEEIKRMHNNIEIFCAVKEKPIINDALIEDAVQCGIGACADILSSGSDAPGTVLSLCGEKFTKTLESADMVISKGQGNFEAFEIEDRPVFYLFMAKCPVVAREAGCGPGDINLIAKGG